MIRSANSDNSGAARAKRIRWQATAGGPKVRTNVGSMALGGILWNQGVYPQEGTIGRVGPEPEPEPGPGPGPDPDTVPDAPTSISAVAGIDQATISFTAPINDGGSTILSYTVTSSPDEITATGSASPITVTGLTNGVTYTFTVVATNAIGSSSPSSASNPVTSGVILRRMVYRSGTRTLMFPTGVTSVDYLLVGGGGGGGGGYDNGAGGGGGGGLVLTGTTSVISGQTYTAVVGAGGVGGVGVGTGSGTPGDGLATVGGNSSFDTIVASGGGLGNGSLEDSSGVGGSQGNAGTLTSPTGGKGGRQIGVTTFNNAFGAGGGGGMGSAGTTAVTATNAAGGSGIISNMTGSNVTYGAGGTGGRVTVNANGSPAGANTGNGGNGAGSTSSDGSTGGNGGSGLVVLTYSGPAILPVAPAITSVQLADVFFVVYFTQDVTNGANDITNYQFSTDGGESFLALSPADAASPVTIIKRSDTGGSLVANTTYQFQLRAVNADGTGAACSDYEVKTMTYARFSPFTSVGGGQEWIAPSDTTIVQYLVQGGGGGSGGTYSKIVQLGNVPVTATNPGSGYWISDTNGLLYNGGVIYTNSSAPVQLTASKRKPYQAEFQTWYEFEVVYYVTDGKPGVINYNYPPSRTAVQPITNNNWSGGSGGGSGGKTLVAIFPVTGGTTYPVTVGDGGNGGTASTNAEANGSSGENSSFSTITANGGTFGFASRNSAPVTGGGGQVELSYLVGGWGGGSNGYDYRGGQGTQVAGGAGLTGSTLNFDGNGSVIYGRGGNGGPPNAPVTTSSTANSGGGGAGTGATLNGFAPGNKGGSGVVIVKYWTDEDLAAPVIQKAIADNGGVYIYFSQPSGTVTNYGYILDGNEPHTIFSPATTSSPLYITDLQNNEEVGIQIVAIGSPSTMVSGESNLVAVTPTDIENETGPTLYYDANDYTSGSITNSAPGGVSLSGTLTSVSRVAGPTTGYVFDFPGSGYIRFGTYNFGTVMTISAWIKSRSKFSTNTLISNCTVGGSANGFAIGWTFWNTNDLDCYMESGNGSTGGKNFSVPNMVTNGVWQHYGCVFDQANRQVIFFINGSPVKIVNITLTYTVGMNNTIFNIGAYADNSYGMNAQLGYIKVYNYLFNATDMLAEYQNNKARFGL